MEAQAIEPAFDILGGHPNVGPSEFLIVCRITVGSEPSLDEGALFIGKPADAFGVIRDEPVGDGCNDNSQETLLEPC